MQIDLNSDLGEGCGMDGDLMPLVTSANICCGKHAGDSATSLAALELAAKHRIQVGAHPGYADREHFGRRDLTLSEEAIFDLCREQVGMLAVLAKKAGIVLRYIKPHGALYNQACRDDAIARPLVAAAESLDLPLMALPGSRLEVLCAARCEFIGEGFADRRYQPDGSLVPRSRPDAFVHGIDEAVAQAEWLLREQGIRTLCVHGDNPQALEFLRGLRAALIRGGIAIQPFA